MKFRKNPSNPFSSAFDSSTSLGRLISRARGPNTAQPEASSPAEEPVVGGARRTSQDLTMRPRTASINTASIKGDAASKVTYRDAAVQTEPVQPSPQVSKRKLAHRLLHDAIRAPSENTPDAFHRLDELTTAIESGELEHQDFFYPHLNGLKRCVLDDVLDSALDGAVDTRGKRPMNQARPGGALLPLIAACARSLHPDVRELAVNRMRLLPDALRASGDSAELKRARILDDAYASLFPPSLKSNPGDGGEASQVHAQPVAAGSERKALTIAELSAMVKKSAADKKRPAAIRKRQELGDTANDRAQRLEIRLNKHLERILIQPEDAHAERKEALEFLGSDDFNFRQSIDRDTVNLYRELLNHGAEFAADDQRKLAELTLDLAANGVAFSLEGLTSIPAMLPIIAADDGMFYRAMSVAASSNLENDVLHAGVMQTVLRNLLAARRNHLAAIVADPEKSAHASTDLTKWAAENPAQANLISVMRCDLLAAKWKHAPSSKEELDQLLARINELQVEGEEKSVYSSGALMFPVSKDAYFLDLFQHAAPRVRSHIATAFVENIKQDDLKTSMDMQRPSETKDDARFTSDISNMKNWIARMSMVHDHIVADPAAKGNFQRWKAAIESLKEYFLDAQYARFTRAQAALEKKAPDTFSSLPPEHGASSARGHHELIDAVDFRVAEMIAVLTSEQVMAAVSNNGRNPALEKDILQTRKFREQVLASKGEPLNAFMAQQIKKANTP